MQSASRSCLLCSHSQHTKIFCINTEIKNYYWPLVLMTICDVYLTCNIFMKIKIIY